MDDPGPEAFLSTFESNSSYSAVRHTVILNIFCIVSRIEEIIWNENDSYKLWRPVMALNILSKNLCLKYIPQASTSKLLKYVRQSWNIETTTRIKYHEDVLDVL